MYALKMILLHESSNEKTGNIIQSYDRKAIVIFAVHGNASKKAAKVIMLKKAH